MPEKFKGSVEELSEEEYLKKKAKESTQREVHPEKFDDERPPEEEIEIVKAEMKRRIKENHRRIV